MDIYIDVGHGGTDATGTDTGASGVLNGTRYSESVCNLAIAKAARDVLVAAGHNVKLSREDASNFGGLVGSYGRADSNLINSANYCKAGTYDFMISIHNNSSSSNKSARGYQLIYKTGDNRKDESYKLAILLGGYLDKTISKNAIYESVAKNGKDNYGILRLHDKIGVLIEALFMSNADDMVYLSDDEKLKDIGTKIGEACLDYAGDPVKTSVDYEEVYKILNDKYGILEEMYDSLKISRESLIVEKNEVLSDLNNELTKVRELENKNNELLGKIDNLEEQVKTLKKEQSSVASKYEKIMSSKGDVNGDGSIDITDAIYLLKHVIKPDKYPIK